MPVANPAQDVVRRTGIEPVTLMDISLGGATSPTAVMLPIPLQVLVKSSFGDLLLKPVNPGAHL